MSDFADSNKRNFASSFDCFAKTSKEDVSRHKKPRLSIAWDNAIRQSPAYICRRCASINLHEIFQTKVSNENTDRKCGVFICDLGELTDGSRSSCSLCRLFAAVRVPGNPSSSLCAYTLRAFSARQHFNPHNGTKGLGDTVIFSVLPGRRESAIPNSVRQCAKSGSVGYIYPVPLQPQCSRNMFVGRQIHSSTIDYRVLNGWVDFCKKYHAPSCRNSDPISIPGFRVIDCCSRRIIPAPECCKYLALSYVWGSQSEELAGDYEELPLPAFEVIEDSILVAKKLGIQFLWVDRYCIRQNQVDEKHIQIRNMDQVYAKAEVTIIASAGQDASHGLPGVSNTPRKPQPFARIGQHLLVSSMRNPRTLVRVSKWATRAWTLQEASLSCRRLIFTEDQVIFECNSMTCQETISAPLEVLYRKVRQQLSLPLRGLRLYPPNNVARKAYDIVTQIKEYTCRFLSYQSDALNGMMGIFRSFETSANPVPHLWGLPILPASFWLLLWSKGGYGYRGSISAGLMDPRPVDSDRLLLFPLLWNVPEPLERNPRFPSWSWTGWHLPSRIEFPVEMLDGDFKVSVLLKNRDPVPWNDIYQSLQYTPSALECLPYLDVEAWAVKIEFEFIPRQNSESKGLDLDHVKSSSFYDRCSFFTNHGLWAKLPNVSVLQRFYITKKVDDVPALRKRFLEEMWCGVKVASAAPKSAMIMVLERVGDVYERVGLIEYCGYTIGHGWLEDPTAKRCTIRIG